jgi:hypothetical protein
MESLPAPVLEEIARSLPDVSVLALRQTSTNIRRNLCDEAARRAVALDLLARETLADLLTACEYRDRMPSPLPLDLARLEYRVDKHGIEYRVFKVGRWHVDGSCACLRWTAPTHVFPGQVLWVHGSMSADNAAHMVANARTISHTRTDPAFDAFIDTFREVASSAAAAR